MRILIQNFILGCGFLALFLTPIFSQTPNPTPIVSYQEIVEKPCLAQSLSGQRTYAFRTVTPPKGDTGAYGKKTWFQKLFPFFASKDKYADDDIRLLNSKYAKPVPLGESKRSKEIRLTAEQKLKDAQAEGERRWQEWLTQNPTANENEKNKAEVKIRFQGLGAAKLPKFDWRENGLDVGEIGDQGNECNVCWAFTAVDAMQISRRLAVLRLQIKESDNLKPSVRQLMSCIAPKDKDICAERWHGDVLSFLVDTGLPFGGSRKYNKEKNVWECEAKTYLKALTWDYVSAKPREIASPDEIKRAIVTYGAVITLLRSDNCFRLYGSGIFNEEFNQGGNHYVLIIGWDDAKGSWLVKNSYGTEWGDGGFAFVKYGSNEIGRVSAVIMADPKEEERLVKEFGQEKK
jgi:C1A family cysteine protease